MLSVKTPNPQIRTLYKQESSWRIVPICVGLCRCRVCTAGCGGRRSFHLVGAAVQFEIEGLKIWPVVRLGAPTFQHDGVEGVGTFGRSRHPVPVGNLLVRFLVAEGWGRAEDGGQKWWTFILTWRQTWRLSMYSGTSLSCDGGNFKNYMYETNVTRRPVVI